MLIKTLRAAWLALAMMMLGASPAHAAADTAICYNCPPEWADWATQLQAIAADTGVHVPPDSKNSGQSLAALIAERHNPMADVVYYGVTFGIQAAEQGLVQPYKPAHWDAIPDDMKNPEGKWFAVHSGTLGFMVNVDALHGVPVPQSWHDLLKPEYRTMVGYLDPGSAFVGYVAAVAVNRALGGTLSDFTPAITWFQTLQANSPSVPRQTAYARVLSGEIPILLDYDFNAYRARYQDHANVRFVIPQEGTIRVPYVMSLVANDPNPKAARKVLDYVLSDKGQAIWADAYLRPVRADAISPRAVRRFLPASDYARADTVDYAKMAAAQRGFAKRYAAEVQ
ncbi:ABC transporter substrate-binding protein [Gammaproteobacteria bacterium MFB021]|nr:ABC transporter substrate-binding protein [Gammaproteobacteria bacterium MFB021]